MKKQRKRQYSPLARSLSGIGPVQIEEIAAAIDGLTNGPARDVANLHSWLRLNPSDSASRAQLSYWQNYISALKHVSSLFRQQVVRRFR